MKILLNRYKLFISISLLLLFYLLRHFLFYDRGISLFEEGHPFYMFDSIVKGKLLYVDLFNYTSPLSNYFYALIIKIFGAELLNIRATSIIVSSMGLLVIFSILKLYLNYFWSWLGTMLSYSLYYLWFYKYGYELGSLFSYLSILSAFLFVKHNKKSFFVLTILFSVGAFGHHIYAQGIPLFMSVLMVFIIFHKKLTNQF